MRRWSLDISEDPLLILLWAAGTRSDVATVLAEFLARESTAPLSAQLRAYGMSAQEAAHRTAAVEALIMGTVVTQRMLPPGASGQMGVEHLRDWLAVSLQSLLDHPAASPVTVGRP